MSAIAEQNSEFINVSQDMSHHLGQTAVRPAGIVYPEYRGVVTNISDFVHTAFRGVSRWLSSRRPAVQADSDLAWDEVAHFEEDSD